MHRVASAGFATDASRYESGRPGYPLEAVDWLCRRLDIGGASVVVDVAAGTGKLSRLLEHRAGRLIAVEPVAEMGRKLVELSPTIEVIAATAEQLPFHADSIDALTVAQAFHWFDAPKAWGEFHRVLKPGGGVGLIWNARDRSVGWVDEVWSIMDRVEKTAPWRNHEAPGLHAGPGFATLTTATFWHEVTVTRQDMIDRVASVSHVAVLPDAERKAVLADVAGALPDADTMVVPYRVDAYATRRIA